MPTNQYLPFAAGAGANTLTPSTYAASPLLALGHQPGVALSEVMNTTLRQTSVAVSGLALLASTYGALDALDNGLPADFMAAFKSAMDGVTALQNFWKPGDIKATIVNSVPAGWLKANGQVVLRATYPLLFAAIGTTYNGSGVAADSFQLPDLRAEFLRGWDDGRGVDASRALGSIQLDALQNIIGYLGVDDRVNNGGAAIGAFRSGFTSQAVAAGAPAVDTTAQGGGEGTHYVKFDASLAARTAAETRPRNAAVLILIRAI